MNLTCKVHNKRGHDSKSCFQVIRYPEYNHGDSKHGTNKGKGCGSDGFKRGRGHNGQHQHGWASAVTNGNGLLGAALIGAALVGAAMTAAGTGQPQITQE
ncbi:hypothetical protein M9H77_05109 [Catharanthus roseus]|uniref:Uncharacterized protein n=1 Tax=Catharanthus roseus TaxID=4058 RepID=A0ACC0CG50_CATRO|nr:hypothetical protein M9H77_05109 [Catharanthus roseus]